MNQLNKLYKQTSSGAIQEWLVASEGNQVFVKFGQLDSDKIQATSELVKGKNIGKKNETTDEQQATLRAKQMFEAKLKKGYTEDLDLAKSTKNTLDGVEPMLAFPIEKKEKTVVFPALAQPKLDGMRCIAMITNYKCQLFTRTQKPINTLPHIVEQIEKAVIELGMPDIVLDGELYNHELKEDFNRLMSLIKRDEVHPDCEVIQYHMYDEVNDGFPYEDRHAILSDVAQYGSNLNVIGNVIVNSREELESAFHIFLKQGYEGAMYRNPNIGYEQKRSTSLLKVKVMDDAEFKVIRVNEGKGKLAGRAGAFVCLTADGKEFKAKLKGNIDELVKYFENFEEYEGEELTVQYQGLTPDGIPRFPVGLRFRIEE